MMYIIDLCLQGEEFDAVKPLMAASVRFKGQMWFHVNFWARCRKSKKIKRFFAEVHYNYKPPGSSSGCSDLPYPVPGAEKPLSSSSVCADLPFPVPEAEKPSSSCSICSDRLFPVPIPIVEACTIIGMYLCDSFSLLAGRYDFIDVNMHAWLQKSLLASTGGAAHSVVVTWTFCTPRVVSLSVETTRTG